MQSLFILNHLVGLYRLKNRVNLVKIY